MKFEECETCWHCKAMTQKKGYCMNRRIEIEYGWCCNFYKEASDQRKKEIRKKVTECKTCHGTGYLKSHSDEPDQPCPHCGYTMPEDGNDE